nr:hypothetical protein [Chenggangzhangella methanolivorans]
MDAADVEAARRRLPAIEVCEDRTLALAEAAAALGICGLRPLIFARAAARAAAALAGRDRPDDADLELAARLVLGPRATCVPAAHDDEEHASEPEGDREDRGGKDDDGAGGDPRELAERVLAAAEATLPPGLLEAGAAAARSAGAAGRSGAQASPRRGRPVGSRPGRPEGGARLDLVATLRAAAPWQGCGGGRRPSPLPRANSASAELAILSAQVGYIRLAMGRGRGWGCFRIRRRRRHRSTRNRAALSGATPTLTLPTRGREAETSRLNRVGRRPSKTKQAKVRPLPASSSAAKTSASSA